MLTPSKHLLVLSSLFGISALGCGTSDGGGGIVGAGGSTGGDGTGTGGASSAVGGSGQAAATGGIANTGGAATGGVGQTVTGGTGGSTPVTTGGTSTGGVGTPPNTGGTQAATGGRGTGTGGLDPETGGTGTGQSSCVPGVNTGDPCDAAVDVDTCERSDRTCECTGGQWACTPTAEGTGGNTGNPGTGGNLGTGGNTGNPGTGGTTSTGGVGAGGGSQADSGGTTGDAGTGNTGETGGISSGEGIVYECGIPDLGDGGKARPSGSSANLQVLDWAGFESAVSYTFDDANSSQYQNWDTLGGLGVRFTFFLQTNKSGDLGSAVWQQALDAGHELANHSHSHQQNCSTQDVDQATSIIKQNWGITPLTIAAPYGNSSYTSCSQGKFLLNRTVNTGSVGANDNTDPLAIPSNIPGGLGVTQGKWQVYCIHGFTGGSDGAFQPIALNSFVSAVEDAKAAGNVWIDTFLNIGSYWMAQKAFKESGSNEWSWTLPDLFPEGKCLRVTVDGGTLSQNDGPIAWNEHGYYEISLDAGNLTWSP